MSFGLLQVFHDESRVHTESRTESFIWPTWVDCSNSVNYDQVQVLSYSKYSSLFLPVVGIEPATSRGFYSEAPSNQTSYPVQHVSLPSNSEWIFGTYKPYVSIRFLFQASYQKFRQINIILLWIYQSFILKPYSALQGAVLRICYL